MAAKADRWMNLPEHTSLTRPTICSLSYFGFYSAMTSSAYKTQPHLDIVGFGLGLE